MSVEIEDNMPPWRIQVLGSRESGCYEISVVNYHKISRAQLHWGWIDKNKVLISTHRDEKVIQDEFVWSNLIDAATKTAEMYNKLFCVNRKLGYE